MPFWKKSQEEFEKTDRAIQQQPGIRQAELARKLGVSRSTIQRRMPSLEDAGYLYSEDDRGGIWPFGRRK